MLSPSTTRIFIHTTTAIRLASSSSSSLRFLSNPTLFRPVFHAYFKPLPSTSSTSLFSSSRTDHTMATSSAKSVHDFTVKVDVNGDSADPLYKYLKSSKGGLFGDNIKWNFSKFLVDKEGKVVDRYAPTTSPLSIEKDLLKLLDA
ncbi:hypothetical protein V8G54_001151 [Vigna mungo]|uniref:Glutathione peroxidase n=1 Tax=Vigna mungo TaxID=3915 RepID=A0AAQ3S9N8_VIGMU